MWRGRARLGPATRKRFARRDLTVGDVEGMNTTGGALLVAGSHAVPCSSTTTCRRSLLSNGVGQGHERFRAVKGVRREVGKVRLRTGLPPCRDVQGGQRS